jgi:hypothetical protein
LIDIGICNEYFTDWWEVIIISRDKEMKTDLMVNKHLS